MTVLEQRAYEAIASMAKKDEPDYWEKLEHQYAGMAMQGILSDPVLLETTLTNAEKFDLTGPQAVAIDAYHYAHALVEKMKEERK